MRFLPDGKTLLTFGWEQNFRLWDISARTNIAFLRVVPGHENEIWSVALAPNGRMIASGSKDGMIKVWNIGGIPGAARGEGSDRCSEHCRYRLFSGWPHHVQPYRWTLLWAVGTPKRCSLGLSGTCPARFRSSGHFPLKALNWRSD